MALLGVRAGLELRCGRGELHRGSGAARWPEERWGFDSVHRTSPRQVCGGGLSGGWCGGVGNGR